MLDVRNDWDIKITVLLDLQNIVCHFMLDVINDWHIKITVDGDIKTEIVV